MSKANCHTGNPLVFETSDGVRVYAGGNTRNGGWMQMQPRPELAIGPQGVIRVARTFDIIPDGFTCINHVQLVDVPHIIELEWPDFDIPSNVGREFWLSLVADVKSRGIKSISCQCMGGHGRTGVQLAIFAHLMIEKKNQTWKDAGELIQWVRDSYCTHAVEAKSQQEYIAKVCEIPRGQNKVEISSSGGGFSWNQLSTTKFDSDELDLEMELASSKKKQVGKNHHTGYKNKSQVKNYANSIANSTKMWNTHVKGFVNYCCNECGHHEFRTNDKKQADEPCPLCYNDMSSEVGEMSLDDKNYKEYCTEKCETTGEMFHPLEMHGGVSKLHYIDDDVLRIRKGGRTWKDRRFKCEDDGKIYPVAFSVIIPDSYGSYNGLPISVKSHKGLNKKTQKNLDGWFE